MIIRSHKTEQRIMQSHFLQIQDDGIGTNQRTEATVRQPAQRFARRLGSRRNTELQWLLAPFFKDPENVSRLAEREPGQRLKERKDAMLSSVLGSDGSWID